MADNKSVKSVTPSKTIEPSKSKEQNLNQPSGQGSGQVQGQGQMIQYKQPTQVQTVGQMQYMVPQMVLIPYYAPMKGVPPGLEALAVSSGIYIQQEMNLIEIFVGWEMNNRYSILNSQGQRIYFAAENTPCGERWCWGQNRKFDVTIFDGLGKPIMTVWRKRNCTLCCWGGHIGGTNVGVTLMSTGEELGKIIQDCNYCTPNYHIVDAKGETVMRIKGPKCGSYCPCVMCCDVQFPVTNEQSKEEVGKITKHFQFVEMISDANAFGLSFDEKMDPNLKAALLGAVLAIDFSFFEGSNGMGGGGRSRGMNFSGYCLIQMLFWILVPTLILLMILFVQLNSAKWETATRRPGKN